MDNVSDERIAEATRQYFKMNPDPEFLAAARQLIETGRGREQLKRQLNEQRLRQGKSFISTREFERLQWIFKLVLTQ